MTAKTGGGIGTIEYRKDEPQNVKTLKDSGNKLFFPNGQSNIGTTDEFTITLENYKGEPIIEFRDINGNEFNFQDYLKGHGIYSSQFNVYIRTCPKTDSSLTQPGTESPTAKSFLCNNKVPEKIALKFSKVKQSLYSNNEINTNCYALKECFHLSGLPAALEEE